MLNGDIYGMIAPYGTANYWWWPYKKKFHWRYYDKVPLTISDQEGFQNTFSVTELEAGAARTLLESGKYLATSNMLFEDIVFGQWEEPNFHEKSTNEVIKEWPVYGWNYDVLIGGLYPDQKPEWEYGLHGKTCEWIIRTLLFLSRLGRGLSLPEPGRLKRPRHTLISIFPDNLFTFT